MPRGARYDSHKRESPRSVMNTHSRARARAPAYERANASIAMRTTAHMEDNKATATCALLNIRACLFGIPSEDKRGCFRFYEALNLLDS